MARFPYGYHFNPRRCTDLMKCKFYPILKIGLFYNSKSILVESFIDTGSQWCLFNNNISKHLGITDYRATREKFDISGAGGKHQDNVAYFHDVTLRVYKKKTVNSKDFWEIKTKIGFLEKEIGCAGILGVYGFLDRFTFKTNIPKGYFEIARAFNEKERVVQR